MQNVLEAFSKLHLASNGRVAIRFKMLTYYVYAPLLNRIDALPLNTTYNFETASICNQIDINHSSNMDLIRSHLKKRILVNPPEADKNRGGREV